MRVRKHLKRMEGRLAREDKRLLRRMDGKPKRHILRKLTAALAARGRRGRGRSAGAAP